MILPFKSIKKKYASILFKKICDLLARKVYPKLTNRKAVTDDCLDQELKESYEDAAGTN
jgi:hypothetical protein